MGIKEHFCTKNKWWVGVVVCLLLGVALAIGLGLWITQTNQVQSYGDAEQIHSLNDPLQETIYKDQIKYFYWVPNEKEGCDGHLTFGTTVKSRSDNEGTLFIVGSTTFPPEFLEYDNSSSVSLLHYEGCCWDAKSNPLFWAVKTTSKMELFEIEVNLIHALVGPKCGLDVDEKVIILWMTVTVTTCGMLIFLGIWIFVGCTMRKRDTSVAYQLIT